MFEKDALKNAQANDLSGFIRNLRITSGEKSEMSGKKILEETDEIDADSCQWCVIIICILQL